MSLWNKAKHIHSINKIMPCLESLFLGIDDIIITMHYFSTVKLLGLCFVASNLLGIEPALADVFVGDGLFIYIIILILPTIIDHSVFAHIKWPF